MALNFGTLIARRLARVYAKIGQTLIISHSFGTSAFVGRVSLLVFDEQASHFPSSEYSTWVRPAYKVQVAGDFRTTGGGPTVGDTIALPDNDGLPGATLTYTVKKTDRAVFADVVYRTTIYLART